MEQPASFLSPHAPRGAASARRSAAASELLIALGDLGVAQERQASNEAIEQISSRVRTAIRLFQDHTPARRAA